MSGNNSVQSTAIVIHQARFGENETTFSVLAHDLHHTDKGSILGAGRPYSHDDKLALMSVLGEYRGSDLEFLDATCLASSHQTLMWYRPRRKTLLNLRGKEVMVAVPSLVFLVHKSTLYVAAYKGDRRPERNTPLFHCSLPNIQSSLGQWCAGGNLLPDRPYQGQIEKIEAMFFESPFTHWKPEFIASETPERYESDSQMIEFFNGIKGKARFPTSQLKPMEAELDRWMRHITRPKNPLHH